LKQKTGSNIPDPGAQYESIVRPHLYHRIVNDDGNIEGFDLRLARRSQDVEQAQLSVLRGSRDAGGSGCRCAGVRAVDDEGFVGELCACGQRLGFIITCISFVTHGSRCS
jgi:hypothetical protein